MAKTKTKKAPKLQGSSKATTTAKEKKPKGEKKAAGRGSSKATTSATKNAVVSKKNSSADGNLDLKEFPMGYKGLLGA